MSIFHALLTDLGEVQYLRKNPVNQLQKQFIIKKCEGFSGASLAGVARAAASRALERAVCDFAGSIDDKGRRGKAVRGQAEMAQERMGDCGTPVAGSRRPEVV